MKQSEAVDVIYSLLPRMKQASPVEVLTKYAKTRDLSPAQLERLGHVYNTASTLSTLEKDRNSAPYLMDVPSLVSGYIRETGTAKRASWLEEKQEKVATAAAAPLAEIPFVWGRAPATNEKAATAPRDLQPARRRAFWAATTLAERVIEEEAEYISKFASALDKIAKSISKEADPLLKFATLKADAQALSSEAESDILTGKLANALAALRVDVVNNTKTAPSFVLARDRTGYQSQLEAAGRYLKLAMESRAALDQALTVAAETVKHLMDDQTIVRQAQKTANEVARLGRAGGLFKEASTAKKPSGYGARAEAEANDLREKMEGLETGEKVNILDLLRPGIGTVGYGTLAGVQGVHDYARTSVPAFLKEFSPEGTAGTMLKPYGEAARNRAENQALDLHQLENDTRSMALLKDVMIRDQVLSTKDPEKVFQAYQSIRNASPEVAGDKEMLTLLLRQALATQGLDVDTASAARKFEAGSYRYDLPGRRP